MSYTSRSKAGPRLVRASGARVVVRMVCVEPTAVEPCGPRMRQVTEIVGEATLKRTPSMRLLGCACAQVLARQRLS